MEIDDACVSHQRPEHDLGVGDDGGGDRERPRRRRDGCEGRARVPRGQQDDHGEQGEEDLRQATVDDGEHVLEQHDAQPAEEPLHRNGDGRDETQRTETATTAPERSGERQREQADHRADQPMAMLVENAADHRRPGIEEHVVAEGRRPVGDGERRPRVRHQAPEEDEDERRPRRHHRQPPRHARLFAQCRPDPTRAGAGWLWGRKSSRDSGELYS